MGSIMSMNSKKSQGPEPISLVLSEDVFHRWTQIGLDRSLKAKLADENSEGLKITIDPRKEIEDLSDKYKETNQEITNDPSFVEDYNEAENVLSTEFPMQTNEEQSLDQNVKEEIVYNNPWDNAEKGLSILELLGSGDFHSDQMPNSEDFLNSDNGISESKTEVDPDELSIPVSAAPSFHDHVVAELPSEAILKNLTLEELNQMAKKALNELPSVESLRVSSFGHVHKGAVEKCEKLEQFWIFKLGSKTNSNITKLQDDLSTFLKKADRVREVSPAPVENACASYYTKVANCYAMKKGELLECRGIVADFADCVRRNSPGNAK